MMRLISRNLRVRKAAILGALMLALSGLTACGEGESEIGWKLKGVKSRTYHIKMLGSARMEPDLFNYQRENLLVNGAPVTVSIQDDTYMVLKNTGGSVLDAEYITGGTSYAAYPDTSSNKKASETLEEIFNKQPSVSLGKFSLEERGATHMPTVNPFLAMKIYLRMPEQDILEKKQTQITKMGYASETICLSLYNRKIKSHEITSNITLNNLTKNEKGEVIADMRYLVTEKVETAYQEGDFARRIFLKRFNDAHFLGQRPLIEDEDDIQKVYTCKYKGRHLFNMTRGWLESSSGEQVIELIKYLDEGTKVIEILRAKIKIQPSDQKIEAKGIYDEELGLMSEGPQEQKPQVKQAMKKESLGAPQEIEPASGQETKRGPQVPSSVPAGDSLPDPDIDIDELIVETP